MGIFNSCISDEDIKNKSKSKKDKKIRESLTETDKAKLELKRQRDRLKKCRIKCESLIAKEVLAARDLMKQKKKKQAILLLKKKKLKENMLANTENKLLTIEQLLSQIDEAELTAETMNAMKQGTEALQALNEEMSLEDVERIMDETKEAIEYQQEIDEALSGKLGSEDKKEVELELEKIEKLLEVEEALKKEALAKALKEEVVDEKHVDVTEKVEETKLDLPDVPEKKLIKKDDAVVKEKSIEMLLN